MEKPPIHCVLVDDQKMFVEALVAQLPQHSRIRVLAAVTSMDELIPLLGRTTPDVLIAEVNLPGRGLFDAAGEIWARCPNLHGLILSSFLADIFLDQALKLGFTGYLLKEESLQQLVSAIERVAAGEWVFSPAVAARLDYDAEADDYRVRHQSELSSLTARQLEVLRHLACGLSVKEISVMMKLSQKSVDSHKYRIMNKLHIHDRVLLSRFAIREGLMAP